MNHHLVLRIDSKFTHSCTCTQTFTDEQQQNSLRLMTKSSSRLDQQHFPSDRLLNLDEQNFFKFQFHQQLYSIPMKDHTAKSQTDNKMITHFSESDGVVYSLLFCKNCSFVSGVKIIATDQVHQNEMNSVILFLPILSSYDNMKKRSHPTIPRTQPSPLPSPPQTTLHKAPPDVVVVSSDDEEQETQVL